MRGTPNAFAAIVAAVLLVHAGASRAATFCVSDSSELRAALATADGNGESDTIRIKTGTYAPGDGGTAFYYFTSQSFGLTLEGGWVTLIADCGLRLDDATATILSGSDDRQVLALSGSGGTSGDLTVRNLTVRDGLTDQDGAGIDIGGPAGYVGDVTIERVIVRNNDSTGVAGGIKAGVDGGRLTIRNSLLIGNRCGSVNCAMTLTVNTTSPAEVRALVAANTIAVNGCTPGAPPTCDFAVRYGGNARAAFANNAFAFNAGTDLRIQGPLDLYYNNVESVIGTPAASGGNQALADPEFVNPLGGDFRLRFESPLRNAGTAAYTLGPLDLDGRNRLNEEQFDIGAYENREVMLRDSFETLP